MSASCAALALLLATAAPQGGDELFAIVRDGARVIVAANRAAVPCDVAVAELARRMDWTLRYHPEALRSQLAEQVVDLALHDEPPARLAQLLAVAAGADAIVRDHDVAGRRRTELTIVTAPDAASAGGRARLRESALSWYRTWLDERVAAGTSDGDDSVRVRWQIAELLREEGELAEAARLYATLCGEDGHALVPTARLRLARTLFDLGPDRLVEAEREARELARLHPSRPEAAEGVLLLGRLLLATGRPRECANTIENAYVRLTGTPDLDEAYLLVARARLELGEPEAARRALRQLAARRSLEELTSDRRRETLLLRGLTEVELDAPLAAIDALTRLLADPGLDATTRAQACVTIGEAFVIGGRAVHAAAASARAQAEVQALDASWRHRAEALRANVAFALGDEQQGLAILADAARSENAPELVAAFAERLLEGGRLQRADEVARRVPDDAGRAADRARLVRIEAGIRQAREVGRLVEALAPATELARTIDDAALRSRAEREIALASFDAGVAPDVASGTFSPQAALVSGLRELRVADQLEANGSRASALARRRAALAGVERARAALAPLAGEPDAPLGALFALARCEEVLGRHEVARDLWEEIVARDHDPDATDDRSGPWGRAAGTALAVERWIEETSDWTPSRDVDTIRWQTR